MGERVALLHDDGTWEWFDGGNYMGGMAVAEFVPKAPAEHADVLAEAVEDFFAVPSEVSLRAALTHYREATHASTGKESGG